MSRVHKHPTISFRVSDREREMIEAKILASGMQKKDYFVRSCIYNRICVVGKKEVIYQAIIAMLDGAKYLWQGVQIDKEKSPDSGNC